MNEVLGRFGPFGDFVGVRDLFSVLSVVNFPFFLQKGGNFGIVMKKLNIASLHVGKICFTHSGRSFPFLVVAGLQSLRIVLVLFGR